MVRSTTQGIRQVGFRVENSSPTHPEPGESYPVGAMHGSLTLFPSVPITFRKPNQPTHTPITSSPRTCAHDLPTALDTTTSPSAND